MDLRIRSPLLAVTLICLAGLVAATGAARADNQSLTVEIAVSGPDAGKLKKALNGLSTLENTKSKGVASLGAVRRLASTDANRFIDALHADGYYGCQVDTKITSTETGYDAAFTVSPGPLFQITGYKIEYTDVGLDSRPTSPAQLHIDTDNSPRGTDILAIQQKIVSKLRDAGYPSAQITERRADARLDKGGAQIVFVTESGELASFGPTVWPDGLRTRTDYLNTFVNWRQGQTYSVAKTDQMRDDLAETGLFTVIDIQPGKTAPDGTTPVDVSLTERKRRTFAAGLSYSTNIGAGAQASWVDRNLLRRGQRFEADADVSQQAQSLKLSFGDPRVFKLTDLILATTLKNEYDDPFTAKTLDMTAELDHHYTHKLIGKAGVELFASASEDSFGRHQSYLVGLPVGAAYSNLDNILNPTKGVSAVARFEPYVGISGGTVSFFQVEGNANYHHPFDRRAQFVLALWTHMGASLGANVEAVPTDKRYYAGGAGSVRAYGYRLIGPTDATGNPTGGRSVLEGGGELRFPVRGNFGGAVFLEGGGVSQSGLFVFDQGIRYGAGIGARYYTSIGPIRADIAFPLNPRPHIDDVVQFYISLGQPF